MYWAVGGYLHIPDGNWNHNVATNLGDHRFSGTLQTAYIFTPLPKLDTELVGDATLYGDNSDAAVTGGTLRQQPTYEGQIWLNYSYSPLNTASLGVSGTFGGYSRVNGVATGQKTEAEQLKLSYAHYFPGPNLQLLVEYDRELHVVGGFKQNAGLMIRLAKVF